MARLNVEDSLWSDPRFLRLCAKLGDEIQAIGSVILAWKLAQKHWCPNKQLIPENVFKEAGLPEELISIGLAERHKDGIRMRGCEEHFEWWFKKVNSGRLGGLAKASNAKQSLSTSKQNVPSYSSSSSYSENIYNSFNTAKGVPKNVDNLENRAKFEDLLKQPERLAKRALDGVRKFGVHDTSSLKEFMGEEAYIFIARKVGWSKVRATPRNEFAVRNVAAEITS